MQRYHPLFDIQASNAINILNNHFDLFIKKHYKKIIHKLSISWACNALSCDLHLGNRFEKEN